MDLLPYQLSAINSKARFTWNCWARQTGKSFTFALRRLKRGLLRRRNQIILSAGHRQSREVMEKLRDHCKSVRLWHEWRGLRFYGDSTIRQLELRFANGMRVIGLPANAQTVRGYTGDVFLDEFAMHRDDAGIWAALSPSVVRGAGELDIASTPRGKLNTFFTLRDNTMFVQRTITLEEAIADGLDVDANEMRLAIGNALAWRQEFCCEFADESTSFMPFEIIRRCQDIRLETAVDAAAVERKGAEIFLGIDVGRIRDLTVIWLWERAGGQFICRGVHVMEAERFSVQEEEIAALLMKPTVGRCCIDATGMGLPMAERLVERFGEYRVEAVTFTSALKSALAGRLRDHAERALLRIPVDETIERDWHSIARSVTAAGHTRFDAGRSGEGHADRFWAAALGLHAASEPTGPPGLITSGRFTFGRAGIW